MAESCQRWLVDGVRLIDNVIRGSRFGCSGRVLMGYGDYNDCLARQTGSVC